MKSKTKLNRRLQSLFARTGRKTRVLCIEAGVCGSLSQTSAYVNSIGGKFGIGVRVSAGSSFVLKLERNRPAGRSGMSLNERYWVAQARQREFRARRSTLCGGTFKNRWSRFLPRTPRVAVCYRSWLVRHKEAILEFLCNAQQRYRASWRNKQKLSPAACEPRFPIR